MERRTGLVAEPYHRGKAGAYMKTGQAVLGRRGRVASILGGAACLAASAATRFGIFHAGVASAVAAYQ
jgi:hypothetical protein